MYIWYILVSVLITVVITPTDMWVQYRAVNHPNNKLIKAATVKGSVTRSSKYDLFSSVIPNFSSLPLSSSNCENKLNLIIIVFMLWSLSQFRLYFLSESVCFTTKCQALVSCFFSFSLKLLAFFFLFAFYCVNPMFCIRISSNLDHNMPNYKSNHLDIFT